MSGSEHRGMPQRRSQSDTHRMTPWQRLTGKGIYPVEYARWLLSQLRYLVTPPRRIVNRLELLASDRVLEVGCGPGFFSPTIARKLSSGHLTLFDVQEQMLQLASARMRRDGAANFACSNGDAQHLPFRDNVFDVVLMVTVLGEVGDRRAAVTDAARILRPNGRLSITEAAGDPDRVDGIELDRLAAQAGLARTGCWRGMLIATHTYRKSAAPTPASNNPASSRPDN